MSCSFCLSPLSIERLLAAHHYLLRPSLPSFLASQSVAVKLNLLMYSSPVFARLSSLVRQKEAQLLPSGPCVWNVVVRADRHRKCIRLLFYLTNHVIWVSISILYRSGILLTEQRKTASLKSSLVGQSDSQYIQSLVCI